MEEEQKGKENLQRPALILEETVPPPLVPSPNAGPHVRLPPLRSKSSHHVFYNYTQPTSPIPNTPSAANSGDGFILPEPAASIAYKKKLDL